MKNKIKEIHNKLSNSNIDSFESIISTSSFSSILKDRFVSELKKMNIIWDLDPTTINKLTNNKKASQPSNVNPDIVTSKVISNKNIGIGIDIQLVSSLPITKDPWEDDFYKDNFNKNEIVHCLKKKNTYESFAGIFALKEAIYKIDKTEKNQIKIKFSKEGKPISNKYSISISHDNNYAIAVAVLDKQPSNSIDIKELNNKIDTNKSFVENIENKLNSIKIKPHKNYFLYFSIISIFLYLLYKDFLFHFFM